jgi:hypothetical protein
MGCNYYFVPKRKKKVKLTEFESMFYYLSFEPIHIGKSSFDWTFSFQKTSYYSSYKELLEFHDKWKDKIKIIDEYDRRVSIEHFKALVEAKKNEQHSQTLYMINNYSSDTDYLDCEGYDFNERDFS